MRALYRTRAAASVEERASRRQLVIAGIWSGGIILLLAAFLFSLAIPLLPATVLYGVLRTTTPFRLSVAALSMRLWRVIAGICLLVALNYLSLWIGQQPWAPNWSR